MITSYQQLSWTEKNDMKNLIIKWLGLDPLAFGSTHLFVETKLRKVIQEEMLKQREENIELVTNLLNNRYDLEGMESKLDDMDYLTQDLESRGNRWDDMADKVEDDSDTFLLDKVQSVDDRLTELVAGYKLDVQLVKEEF
jgi:hypothetical protein